jgi:hypothetical protein
MRHFTPTKHVHPNQIRLLHSMLQRFGGSYLGAQQIMNGQTPTNPDDHAALAKLIVIVTSHFSDYISEREKESNNLQTMLNACRRSDEFLANLFGWQSHWPDPRPTVHFTGTRFIG